MEFTELRKLLESPSLTVSNVDCIVPTPKSSTDSDTNLKISGQLKFAEMKQKVSESLRKNKKENEETSGSDTEHLGLHFFMLNEKIIEITLFCVSFKYIVHIKY